MDLYVFLVEMLIIGFLMDNFLSLGKSGIVEVKFLKFALEILFFWIFKSFKFGSFLKDEIRIVKLFLVMKLCVSIRFFNCIIEESEFVNVDKLLLLIMVDFKCNFLRDFIFGRNFVSI